MHDMVTAWRKLVSAAYIVAGLPAFSTLNDIADIIKLKAHKSFLGTRLALSESSVRVEADLISPAGRPACCHRDIDIARSRS
jgi:hypothetical protein